MRKLFLSALVGVVMTLYPIPASAGRPSANVRVWQYGAECVDRTVHSGDPFSLAGTGFRTWTPAKICLTGQYPCLVADVDSAGSFTQAEFLYYPGTYQVHVYQMKSRSGGRSDLVYSGELTVVQ